MKRIREFFCRLLGHKTKRFGLHLAMCFRCDGLFHKRLVVYHSEQYGDIQQYVLERIA